MALNEGEYTARIMLPFEFIRIPKVQDYVNVMVKEHGLYSVKIESISGQPQTAQAQKDVAAYCAHLYDYLLPSVMDCIPLSSDPDYYQNNDSFDVRLAKFLAAGGDKKDVCTAAEELLKHNFVVQDAEDEENGQFLPDIDNGRFYSQTKWLQKVLKGEN